MATNRIKEVIKEKGYSVPTFAEKLGLSKSAIYQQLDAPSYPTLLRFAEVLNVPLWQLFASKEEICKPPFVAFVSMNGNDYKFNTPKELADFVAGWNTSEPF